MTKKYVEQIYAGLLGMNIGIRLGAPLEPLIWSSQKIEEYFGNIKSYVTTYKNFAADDDVNGPLYLIRSFIDKKADELTMNDVASTWLNYTRDHIGMFWWGGLGISTEHTAFQHLKDGMNPSLSGLAKVNGQTLSEQIGGQIFIDGFGFVFPNCPEKASHYARMAASVMHDGEAVYGASFVAACISLAFTALNIESMICDALSFIPNNSLYYKMTKEIMHFYQSHSDWKECLRYIQAHWGYDKYPGICHVLPNAAICVMSMLYGDSFASALEISVMSGWDTDCNAATIGSILGVFYGINEIPNHYRAPINDMVVLSGVSGELNIVDLPSKAHELYQLSKALKENKECPIGNKYLSFRFDLPGATHGLRLSNSHRFIMRHSKKITLSGGSAEIHFEDLSLLNSCKIFYKPFYRRFDFDDERYSPVFSPTVYPGQQMQMKIYLEADQQALITPYCRNTYNQQDIELPGIVLKQNQWETIQFQIPAMDGAMVDEIGLILHSDRFEEESFSGSLYIGEIESFGKTNCLIDFEKQCFEFGTVTPFSMNHGHCELVDNRMQIISFKEGMEAYTGHYYAENIKIDAEITPHFGTSHLLFVRAKGILYGYYAGLFENGVCILKKENGHFVSLAQEQFYWTNKKSYHLSFSAIDEELSLSINGQKLLTIKDDRLAYGMCGFATRETARTELLNFKIQEI